MAQFVIRQGDFEQATTRFIQCREVVQRMLDTVQQTWFVKSQSLTQQKVEVLQQTLAQCMQCFINFLNKIMAFLESVYTTFVTVDNQLRKEQSDA